MAESPPLFVRHGDDGGIWIHPCRRVQEALRAARVKYERVITGHGSGLPIRHSGLKVESAGSSNWTLRRGNVVKVSPDRDGDKALEAAGLEA